jgi:molybdenum-dependent DNA-binding transcriptional regulator ModE
MKIAQRQAAGISRSLNVSLEQAAKLVDLGYTTVRDVVAADEAVLLDLKIKTKVGEKIAQIKASEKVREEKIKEL